MDDLTGRIALVTGASSGVGAAVGTGRTKGAPTVEAMMTPEDVAEVVLFALTRPRTMRMLTTTFRPMSEGTFG